MKGSPSESGSSKPKTANNEETGEKAVAAMRECEFCGKKFSSGKALGGHKRFHLQAQRKERELADKANSNCDDDNNNGSMKLLSHLDSGGERLICCLCNKDFPSEKSLFGHMRSHPDRDWRGVHPPPTPFDVKNAHSCTSNPDDPVEADDTPIGPAIDISKSLPPSWLKTDIRGRESIWDAMARVLVSMVGELHNNGANLQQDGDFDSDRVSSEDEQDDGEDKDDDEEEEEEEDYSLKKMKRPLEGMNTEATTSRLKDNDSHIDEGVVMMGESKKRKLIVRFKTHQYSKCEDERVNKILKTQDGFQCNTCDKSFPTFQALGGHRSSHNKGKNKSQMDEQRPSKNIGESSQSSSKDLRNFDLNELPDDIEDEEN